MLKKNIDGINLITPKGEFAVMFGSIRSGKSIFLNLLGDMDSVTSGSIIIDGERIEKYNKGKLAEYRAQNVGFIFQFYNILSIMMSMIVMIIVVAIILGLVIIYNLGILS